MTSLTLVSVYENKQICKFYLIKHTYVNKKSGNQEIYLCFSLFYPVIIQKYEFLFFQNSMPILKRSTYLNIYLIFFVLLRNTNRFPILFFRIRFVFSSIERMPWNPN